ncbi:MAG: hypothetical protein WBF34_04830 [Streptosporangiaceae bacterium]|jgi:hypothetical protein
MRLTAGPVLAARASPSNPDLPLPRRESDQAFRLCPQMKYPIGRTLAELASAAAAVVTWLGVEHINRLGGQPLRGLEDFIEVPYQEAAVRQVGRRSGSSMTSPARA